MTFVGSHKPNSTLFPTRDRQGAEEGKNGINLSGNGTSFEPGTPPRMNLVNRAQGDTMIRRNFFGTIRRGPSALRKIIDISRCQLNGGTFVSCDAHELAVFLLDEPPGVFVIDNTCPHANGNLSGGSVEGCIVTCPWHQWQFSLDTGACMHSDKARVRRYEAEIRDGTVWVNLEPSH